MFICLYVYMVIGFNVYMCDRIVVELTIYNYMQLKLLILFL